MIPGQIGTSAWSLLSFGLTSGKLAVLVGALYLAFRWLRSAAGRGERIDQHRAVVAVILTAAVIAIIIGAGIMSEETAQIDRAILVWLHDQSVPDLVTASLTVTVAGSWLVLVPISLLAVCGLLAMRRRKEALYVATCTAVGILLTITLKLVIGRERPTLWDHDAYWGSSFPSGHTLNTTCVAGALAVCAWRIWPRATPFAVVIAATWVLLVGLSRMVLGVHWPTDVLAAASIGLTVTAAIHPWIFKRTPG